MISSGIVAGMLLPRVSRELTSTQVLCQGSTGSVCTHFWGADDKCESSPRHFFHLSFFVSASLFCPRTPEEEEGRIYFPILIYREIWGKAQGPGNTRSSEIPRLFCPPGGLVPEPLCLWTHCLRDWVGRGMWENRLNTTHCPSGQVYFQRCENSTTALQLFQQNVIFFLTKIISS